MGFNSSQASPDKHTGYTFRGKEIILAGTHGRPKTGLTAKGIERGIFPPEKEIEIATLFAMTGNIEFAAQKANVQVVHARKLMKTQGFKDLLKEIREENSEKFDAKFSEIVEKAQDELLDRLNEGDVAVLKDGTVIRHPIKAKDLSVINAIAFDKLQLQRGKPTSRVEKLDSDDKLELLAQKFIELAHKASGKRLPTTVEEEVVDAQYVVEEASPADGGSGTQPEVRQESGNPTECG